MKKILSLVIAILILLAIGPEETLAQSYIQISHEAGYDQRVKEGRSYPLHLTVTNMGTDAFSGDLVIHFSSSYRSRGAHVVSVYLEGGETKEYTVIMPPASDYGYYFGPGDEQIQLFRGSWQDGRKVVFVGERQVETTSVLPETVTAGILSENPDRLASLKGVTDITRQWHNLQVDLIPEDARGLEYFDYIIVDEFPLATLSKEQQEALLNWIKAGGTFVVGATENPRQTYGIFFSELPLQGDGIGTSTDVTFAGEGHVTSLPIMTGTLNAGEIVVQNGETPLVVKKDTGSGQIIQMAFSIGAGPVITAEGYPEWFTSFIGINNSTIHHTVRDLYDSLYWDIGRYNEFFGGPNLSLGQLTGILVLYLLLLVPALYWILKRIDRREHAWWIIPSLSIICSVLIFGVGAKDRLARAQINEMGIFVSENNYLHGIHVLSLQSNRGGEYVVNAKKSEFFPVPISSQEFSLESKNKLPRFQETRNRLDIIYPEMEYWSVRTLIGEATKHVEGSFSWELSLDAGTLTGTITNAFPYDFEEVFIWSGMEQFSLGALQQGETVQVHIDVGQAFLHTPLSPDIYMYVEGNDEWNLVAREVLLKSSIHQYAFNHAAPVIAGITNDEIIATELVDKKAERRQKSLILVPFHPEIVRLGEVTLHSDDFHIEFHSISGTHYEEYFLSPGEIEIYGEPGLYEFIYHLPAGLDRKQLNVSELTIDLPSSDQFSILHDSEEQFITLDPEDGLRMVITEGADQYITENGEIIIRVMKQSHDDRTLTPPNIRLKGSVAGND